MSLSTAFHSLTASIASAASGIYNALPSNIKTLLHGKIAEAQLTMPDAPGSDKRQWVAAELSKLTGLAEGIWHGLVHLGVAELAAKAPSAMLNFVPALTGVVEGAADSLGDGLIERGAAKIAAAPQTQAIAQTIAAAAPVVTAAVGAMREAGQPSLPLNPVVAQIVDVPPAPSPFSPAPLPSSVIQPVAPSTAPPGESKPAGS